MSEIKGQLLGIVMVLLVFGAVSGVITGIFYKLKTTIKNKSDTMVEDVEESLSTQSHEPLLTYYEY